jgi:hypothetical protein
VRGKAHKAKAGASQWRCWQCPQVTHSEGVTRSGSARVATVPLGSFHGMVLVRLRSPRAQVAVNRISVGELADEDVDRIPSALHQPLNVHAELPDWILDLVPPAGDHRRVMPGISRRASLKGTSAARVPSFGPAPTSFHPHFS